MIDFQKLCDDFNIEYTQGGKHFRPGWTNISCCHCIGSPGFHLGINHQKAYSVCFRCGYHSLFDTIAKLTGLSSKSTIDTIKKYSTDTCHLRQPQYDIKTLSELNFPSGTGPLTKKAQQYLIKRKFDPEKLENTWGLHSTSHYGFYKNRILAPIYQKNKITSFQTRDITGFAKQKYLACFQNEEIVQHQKSIYGLDQAVNNNTCIVVEGITDTWRLGIGAISTFGIAFTKQQAQIIASHFRKVFILFDSEPQAQEQASNLGFLISNAFRYPVEVINLPFIAPNLDPGDMKQQDADALMKEIGL